MNPGRRVKILAVLVLFGLLAGCSSIPDEMEEELQQLRLEKLKRISLYLSAARKAEEEGQTEVAIYLGEVVEEESAHLLELGAIPSKKPESTSTNLNQLLKLEKRVAKDYSRLAEIAEEEENPGLAELFSKLARDEKRHAAGLEGLIKRKK